MVASSFGVIFYLALHTGQSCELAFRDMARATGFKSGDPAELSAMVEFSRAACSTSNPDIIWQLAFQESNFRFQLLRENLPGNRANLYEGEASRSFLNRLGRFDLNRNIDIGVMQFNWAWHHQGFEQNPQRLMEPKAQVDYFLKSFSGEIFGRCHGRWVGCYHSTNDNSRAQKYEQDVLEKGRRLRLHALRSIRNMRTAMSETQRSVLPAILQSDIDKLLEFAREVPIPVRK